MKTLPRLLCAAVVSFAAPLLRAQDPSDIEAPVPFDSIAFTEEQLDQLLAPIAIYPDALIALILPASTVPTDIVLAARYLRDNGDSLAHIESRAWDDSVKSLARYPELLKWLDENLTWTKQLGEAFSTQPADVMRAIQRLRARARAAGTLTDSPQQHVLAEPDVIRIVPADPQVIYVPSYEPAAVFLTTPIFYATPVVRFGRPRHVGPWLAYDFDWRRCTLWVGDRNRPWTGHHDWRRPLVPHTPTPPGFVHHRGSREWCPPPRPHHPTTTFARAQPSRSQPSSRSLSPRTYVETGPVAHPGHDAPRASVTTTPSPTPRTFQLQNPALVRRSGDPRPRPETRTHPTSHRWQTTRPSHRDDISRSEPGPAPLTVPSLNVVGPASGADATVTAAPTRVEAPRRSATFSRPPARSVTAPPAQVSAPPANESPASVAPAPAAPPVRSERPRGFRNQVLP